MFFIYFEKKLFSGLLINEIAFGTSGDDWVELFYSDGVIQSLDISDLHVTMYYGGSETLSNDAVTIYSYDRPETPWDDRFVVVHLTAPGKTDETGIVDTNNNGYIDVYCDNYSGSLWSTDCVAAIDSDNSSANGDIMDFAAYSNRDGSPNASISSYVVNAQSFGQWAAYSGDNIQECMTDIGTDEIPAYISLARKSPADTNFPDDFALTKFMTPGRENILSENVASKGKLFKPRKKKITITPEKLINSYGTIEIFVYEICNLRFRIFSSIGLLVYESPLYENINPGNMRLTWDTGKMNGSKVTGLYISQIEATRAELKKSQKERIYLILGKFR